MTDTIPVSRETLLDIADVIGGMFPEVAQRILDLPSGEAPEPRSRLRVINLGSGHEVSEYRSDRTESTDRYVFDQEYIDALSRRPDVVTLVRQQIILWNGVHRAFASDQQINDLAERIRVALEGAAQ